MGLRSCSSGEARRTPCGRHVSIYVADRSASSSHTCPLRMRQHVDEVDPRAIYAALALGCRTGCTAVCGDRTQARTGQSAGPALCGRHDPAEQLGVLAHNRRRCLEVCDGQRQACKEEGCSKDLGAIGSTQYCAAHGGGRRCQEAGCTKLKVAARTTAMRMAGAGGARRRAA